MKTRGLLLIIITSLLSVTCFGQSTKQFLKAGEKFIAGKNYEAAIGQFSRVIDIDPSNPEGYIARAGAYERAGRVEEAYSDLEKALVLSPKNIKILTSLGRNCNHLGKYEEAVVHLNKAAAIDKRDADIYPEKVNALYKLGRFDQALKASDTALLLKDNSANYYARGLIYISLNNYITANKELGKSIAKDKENPLPRIALVGLLIKDGKVGEALGQANTVLQKDNRNTDAYKARSQVYVASMDFPSAINDISKNIVLEPENPEHYYDRGVLYQKFNQHANAINDFSKYISLKNDNYLVYFARAKSYEETRSFDGAIADYTKITELSEFNQEARKGLKEANERLYEINRESVAPVITLVNPPQPKEDVLEVRGGSKTLLVTGRIADKSKIDTVLINNERVPVVLEKEGVYGFAANITVEGLSLLSIVAKDVYENTGTRNFNLLHTEINKPVIAITAPFSRDGQVYLDSNSPSVFIQGKISDESLIENILVDNISASFDKNAMNPVFTAKLDIANVEKFMVTAEDKYGNREQMEFSLNREGAEIAAGNPMGKTWVVFIENSSYESFAALDGPRNDVNTLRRALENYQIHQTIHLKDMKKAELERYFNIELRDLLRQNQVKSLLIWYAGHGKTINETGYWIPVDAKRDDEYSYFNVNQLKAGLASYTDVVHKLVISDACETGAGFYMAMRSTGDDPSCHNSIVAGAKSAQVFSSAGYELASDNSKFTSTFASTLMNNRNSCIPIETIARLVTNAVETDSGQKPKFGKIPGIEDENGTFFFIAK
jgi:tetratricopeptide (TPR) repeat protein